MAFSWDNQSYVIDSSGNYKKLLRDFNTGQTQEGDIIKYANKKDLIEPSINFLSETSTTITINVEIINQVGLNTKQLYLYKNDILYDIQYVDFEPYEVILQKSNFKKGDIFYTRLYDNYRLSKKSNVYQINETIQQLDIFEKFDFIKFFEKDNQDVQDYVDNLILKCIEGDIFPKYFNKDSEDFQTLISSIIRIFSYYVVYSKKLSQFNSNIDSLIEFLKINEININSVEQNIVNKISQTLIYQFSLRGSNYTFLKKYNLDNIEFNGELFRYLLLDINDEFECNFLDYCDIGWFLNKSSPISLKLNSSKFQKIEKQNGEKLKNDIDSLDYFSYRGTPTIVADSNKSVLSVNKNNSIGNLPLLYDNILTNKHLIHVDNSFDYLFKISLKTLNTQGSSISIGFLGFNELGLYIEMAFKDYKLNNYSNFFINNTNINTKGEYYSFDFLLLNKNTDSNYFTKNKGLIFSENIKFILPFFYVHGNTDTVYLHNISIKSISLSSTASFLNNKKIISLICSKKIDSLSKKYIIEKFIPYDTTLLINTGIRKKGNCNDTFSYLQNWENTGQYKCIEGVKHVKYINNNDCISNIFEKYEKVLPEEECDNCLEYENTTVLKVILYSEGENYFTYQGKKYKKKTTITKRDNQCGEVVEIIYENEVKTNCLNRNTNRDLQPISEITCKNNCNVKVYKTYTEVQQIGKCDTILYKTYKDNESVLCEIEIGEIKQFTLNTGNYIKYKIINGTII